MRVRLAQPIRRHLQQVNVTQVALTWSEFPLRAPRMAHRLSIDQAPESVKKALAEILLSLVWDLDPMFLNMLVSMTLSWNMLALSLLLVVCLSVIS